MLHWQTKKGKEENPFLFPTQMWLQSHSKNRSALPKATLLPSFATLVGRKVSKDATTKHTFLINKNSKIQRINISFAELTKQSITPAVKKLQKPKLNNHPQNNL